MQRLDGSSLNAIKIAFEIFYTHFATKIQVQDEEQVSKDMIKLTHNFNTLEAIKLAITFHLEDEFSKVEVTEIKFSQ